LNKSILEYLLSKGVLTAEQAAAVQVERTKNAKTEEQAIIGLGFLDNESLIKARSELFNIPFIDLRKVEIPEATLAELNTDVMKQFSVIPFEHTGHIVKLAMLDPFDVQAIQAIELKYPASETIQVHITSPDSLKYILERKISEGLGSEVSDALEDYETPLNDLDAVGDAYVGDDDLAKMDFKNAPVARIVNSMFRFAVTSGASDIHIEPMETKLRIRFRIHGILMEKLSLPRTTASAVVSRVKILSRLKIDEKRVPQDGRLQLKVTDKKVDVRVSIIPDIYGEKVVMRLLETDVSGIRLEDTGLRGMAYQRFTDATKLTNGIILVTGPTGSGKTRTLAATLMRLNDPKVNIITLEDPVEIRVPGVNQVQVRSDVGLSFANGLRSILRQDPNIIMVGEIRDQETAQLAVQASLTGHIVLSTLHTNSASAAIPRLLDMGVEPYLLASTLRCVAAQRLPRRICPNCKEAYVANPEVLENIKKTLGNIKGFDPVDYLTKILSSNTTKPEEEKIQIVAPKKEPNGAETIYLYRGKGCQRCGDTGYKGRIGIFEVLTVGDKIGRMMMENVPDSEVAKVAVDEGMITIIQDGYLKALEGITTIEEVLRVSKE
jgi:type IV pilus assembly protein PilB